MKVKLGGKEYTIQFATRPSLKAHILQDIMKTQDMEDISSMEDILLETLPKMLLVGLQMHHNDEFGYDYKRFFSAYDGVDSESADTGEEKDPIQGEDQELTWEYYVAEIRPFYLMVTKGYGFSVDDIDMMNPELLKPYVDAYKTEWKQRDMEMYMWFGRYATSALVTAIDATFGKGNSKYVKETCYDSIEKHNTDDPDAEIREMLKAEEAWAAESRKSHLPKPKIV